MFAHLVPAQKISVFGLYAQVFGFGIATLFIKSLRGKRGFNDNFINSFKELLLGKFNQRSAKAPALIFGQNVQPLYLVAS